MAESSKAELGVELFDVRDLAFSLWQRKLWLLLGVVGGAMLGYTEIRDFQPVYTGYMMVQSSPEGNASGLIKQISGLRDIAGLVGAGRAGGETSPVFDRFRMLVGTVSFAERLDKKYDLRKRLYASGWDEEKQQWRKPEGRVFAFKQVLFKKLKMRTWRSPDTEMLAEYLAGAIVFEPIENTAFERISFRHQDPEFALFVLRTVFFEADAYLRLDEKNRAEQKRDYLWRQLSNTERTETRTALLTLLASEEKSSMMLAGELPYLAEIVEPPRLSSDTLYIRAFRTIYIYSGVGLVFMVVLVSLFVIFRRESSNNDRYRGGNLNS